jgi:hypothetical protein
VRSVTPDDVRLPRAPADTLSVNADGDVVRLRSPFRDGWHRVIAWNRADRPADDAPVTLDETQWVIARILRRDYSMHDVRWMSRFHSDEGQAPY